MRFLDNAYNTNLCKVMVEGDFLKSLTTELEEQYFEEFKTSCNSDEREHIKVKLDVLGEIFNLIYTGAQRARADS